LSRAYRTELNRRRQPFGVALQSFYQRHGQVAVNSIIADSTDDFVWQNVVNPQGYNLWPC
jgi:hypothetical protein